MTSGSVVLSERPSIVTRCQTERKPQRSAGAFSIHGNYRRRHYGPRGGWWSHGLPTSGEPVRRSTKGPLQASDVCRRPHQQGCRNLKLARGQGRRGCPVCAQQNASPSLERRRTFRSSELLRLRVQQLKTLVDKDGALKDRAAGQKTLSPPLAEAIILACRHKERRRQRGKRRGAFQNKSVQLYIHTRVSSANRADGDKYKSGRRLPEIMVSSRAHARRSAGD